MHETIKVTVPKPKKVSYTDMHCTYLGMVCILTHMKLTNTHMYALYIYINTIYFSPFKFAGRPVLVCLLTTGISWYLLQYIITCVDPIDLSLDGNLVTHLSFGCMSASVPLDFMTCVKNYHILEFISIFQVHQFFKLNIVTVTSLFSLCMCSHDPALVYII